MITLNVMLAGLRNFVHRSQHKPNILGRKYGQFSVDPYYDQTSITGLSYNTGKIFIKNSVKKESSNTINLII